ncbi:hypothetical protein PIB30_106430 [Stylosanthes scabra]|uniref:SWIM-type domain-containing protein n=1 Tax=Stylosanthes scabra TaxID=79078 RepID=A0ABU6ZXE3_9FABA|nr:hypothetical protein [Stylosanthes scabra]
MPGSVAEIQTAPVRVGDTVDESVEHNGIKAALEDPEGGWLPPAAYRAFCARHVAANFAQKFSKAANAKRLLMNAAYARSEEAEAQLGAGQRYSQTLIRAMEKNVRDSRSFAVTQFDRHSSEFEVTQISPTGGFSLGSYRVSLPGQRCNYGSFQALHYPCMHAVACCAHTRVNWATYVHDVYKMSEVFSVYRMSFTPPIPEGFWPPNAGPTVIPDPRMRRVMRVHH